MLLKLGMATLQSVAELVQPSKLIGLFDQKEELQTFLLEILTSQDAVPLLKTYYKSIMFKLFSEGIYDDFKKSNES